MNDEKIMGKERIMPFGKYKGKTIKNIIENHPYYHMWACRNNVMPLAEYPCTYIPAPTKRKNTYSQYGYDHDAIYEYGEN
jgi:hypothetical protein